ncbi:SUMF1/EgtB/PvdO family nonheme iron enzyme [Pontibacter saemangeumensis]|uniref:SUMF1/EgtB/PvdO family nonheme iron enzyme n=1 Tax=Pontibacter saemangeumensis TaxID=1084525 RepID=A0ABP8M3W3_9BACT
MDFAVIRDQLAVVPDGIIEMRDDRIKEKWFVEINSFFLSKLPVTQELYFAVTHENPSKFMGNNLPVETVSWKEAVVFCNKLSELLEFLPCYSIDQTGDNITFNPRANGFRLPTEAEWQFACQAGTNTIRYGELKEIAWYKANSGNQTHAVGGKEPNNWGLYDMLGNVWEWCSDMYDETVYGSYRILRGGGWCDEARSVMATTRRRSHPISFKIDDLGFRIAKNMDQDKSCS